MGLKHKQNYKVIDETLDECFVCIAMLAYNHEDFIEQALNSIITQKVKFKYKIIVAEDYSTDNTRDILKKYQIKYPNLIKLILQNKNIGAQQNNIDLLYNLEGKYTAALEGDDYWLDTFKLQKQIDFLEAHPSYSFCWTRFKTYNQNNNSFALDFNSKYFNDSQSFIDFNFEISYKGWHIGTQTLVFKNSSFSLSSCIHFKYFKDVHIVAQLLKKGKGACLNFVGAVYRIHDGGIHTSVTPFNGYKIGYLTHKEIYLDNKSNPFLKKKYLLSYKNYLNALIREGYLKKALWISFDLLFKNGQFVEFLRHLKRVVVKFTANEK